MTRAQGGEKQTQLKLGSKKNSKNDEAAAAEAEVTRNVTSLMELNRRAASEEDPVVRAAIKMQAWFRQLMTKRWIKGWHEDARIIQSAWRSKKANKETQARRVAKQAKDREAAREENYIKMEQQVQDQDKLFQAQQLLFSRANAMQMFAFMRRRQNELNLSYVIRRWREAYTKILTKPPLDDLRLRGRKIMGNVKGLS